MEINKDYKLLSDIYSNYKDKRGNPIKYGSKRDKVKLIADHDEVLIVEDKKGVRFPVKRELITIQ